MTCFRPKSSIIQVLRSTEQLEALAPALLDLWTSDPHATPFQHPVWLISWWHHFIQLDLRLVTISEDETLLAVLPLYIYNDPASGERQLLLLGAGTSDYLDGLVSPDCTVPHLLAALTALREDPDWDVAHFTQLRPNSLLRQALQQLAEEPTSLGSITPYPGEPCSHCPAVAIADLPRKLRSDVRYFRNAAIGRGALELTVVSANEVQQAFDLLVRFHTDRWQQAGESGVLADPAVLAWHREALPLLAAHGLLRLVTLRLAGESIAVLYSLIDPPSRASRRQSFYLMGFSTEHTALHPGTLLTALAIEHAAAEGVETIDMLRGGETYKQFWHVTPAPTFGYAVRRA